MKKRKPSHLYGIEGRLKKMKHKSVFHQNLKLARKARGYTQKEISEQLNISISTYCYYENGRRQPNLVTIEKIAHILYVSIDELFGLYDFGTKDFIRNTSEIHQI